MAQVAYLLKDEQPAEADRCAPPPVDGIRAAGRLELAVTSDIATLESEWQQFERRGDCTAFQTFVWLSTWQRHVGALAGARPAIVTVRRAGGDLLAIVPLATQRRGFLRELSFLGSNLCDYNGPLLAPEFSRAVPSFAPLWRSILDLLRSEPAHKHDVIVLDKMPEQIGRQANPFLQLPTQLHPSGAYVACLSGTWDEFYAAKRSATTRRRDRTKRKKLAELGDVHFVDPRKPDELSQTLETLLTQKSRAFKRMGIEDLLQRPGYRAFFAALVLARSPNLAVHVSRLDVGEIPAATNLGLVFRGRYYHVLASYDEGPTAKYGPGAAHLHELMRYALERGCGEFDFTIGDEPYKRDWSDLELKLHDHFAAATARGAIAGFGLMLMRRAKRTIKQTPALWALVTRLRAMKAQGARSLAQ